MNELWYAIRFPESERGKTVRFLIPGFEREALESERHTANGPATSAPPAPSAAGE